MMSEPQHLHPAAILILAIRVGRQMVVPLLVPIVINLFQSGLRGIDYPFLIFAGFLLGLLIVVSVGWGILYWRRYTFQVVDNELQIQQGIIFRKRRTIPKERIQAIDFVEGVLHRIFGLVAVRVQTAGGGGPGLSLVGISRDDADRLRKALSRRPGEATPREAEAGAVEVEESGPVRALPVPMLLLAAATSGGIGIALPVIASGMSILNNALSEIDLFDIAAGYLGGQGWLSLAIFILIAAWVLSFAGTILAHASFTIRRVEDNLLIERGLIERRRATVPINRIQAVRVVDGIFRQPIGYTMIRVESAGYGESAGESTVLFPLIHRSEVQGFLEEMAPEFAWMPSTLERPPKRARRRYITRMTLLGMGTTGVISLVLFPVGLYALLTLPLFVLLGWLQYRDAGWTTDGDTLVLCYRTVTRSTAIVPKRRIQSSDASQMILQIRPRLANFSVTVASGPSGASFGLLHLDKGIADQLLAWTGRGRTRIDRSRLPRQLAPPTSREFTSSEG